MIWNSINKQKGKVGKVDQSSEKVYKSFMSAKRTNLCECHSFLLEFASLLLCSYLCFFSTTYYCGWALI